MKTKTIGHLHKLKSGLLYAGLHGVSAAVVTEDKATVFDESLSLDLKCRFYESLFGGKFEPVLCN